jgi:hypothetical protein
MDIENILEVIYNNSQPPKKYLAYYWGKFGTDLSDLVNKIPDIQFYNMVNIGLVLGGIRPACLVYLNNKAKKLLEKYNCHIKKEKYFHHLSLVSLHQIDITKNPSGYDLGVELGYLTPVVFSAKFNIKSEYTIKLDITYKHIYNNNENKQISKIGKISILDQAVSNKTKKQILAYLNKYVTGINNLLLPKQFAILDIKPIIIS